MSYPISNVTRRVVYSGSAGVGPYSFSFEILTNTDIAVYKNTTLLTLTTNYTVTINANGTGSVTLVVAATGADQITLVGNRAIERASDFVTGGDLFANTLNDEFDSLVIYSQQIKEEASRGLKAPITDPTDVNMILPVKSSRKGKVLAFDETTGDPVNGPALDSVTTVIAQSANINTVATNIASVNTVAGNNTNINTVAGISGNVTTVAGISAAVTTNATNIVAIQNASTNATNAATSASNASTAQTAAEAARDATLAAYDSFDDRYLGAKASNPTVDNDGNALLAGALYYNTTVPEMRLYTGSAWVAAYVSGASYLLTTNNLSELTASASTARTNLGLGTASTMTGPSGTIVGTTDTQTLTNKTLTTPVISSISNTGTLTLPTSTDTLVGRATTDTLTNKTLTSPTLTTPALGTPASGTLSSCTVDGTNAVGFRNIPVNSQSAAYTAVLEDSGKVIFHPSTDANARTFTIPANSSVAYAIGTAITFINMTSQVVTIAITTDTMYLSSAGTTGSRSLAQYGSATAIKMTSTTWLISGSGLT
jgi:hypothetical protein